MFGVIIMIIIIIIIIIKCKAAPLQAEGAQRVPGS